jgi:hypothetical protein
VNPAAAGETTGTSTNKGFRPGCCRGGGNPAICGSCDPPGRTCVGALIRWLALAGLASPPANLHGPSGTRISERSKFITRSSISVQGSMFTRAFRASFVAPSTDIEQWLQQSPGTREALPTSPSPGIRHFSIAPGGGAQHAEVTVDDRRHYVSIYVYWS